MATIGRAAAVAQIGNREFCGWFAWILWLVVHLMQIVLFQNRILILLQWAWLYLTFNRSARLITDTKKDTKKGSDPFLVE
jgi:NADH dehydrogenase